MKRSLLFIGLFSVLVTLGGSGCGGSSSSTSVTPNLMFTADVSSVFKNLYTLNGGANQVGLNDLTGTTTISGATVKVEVLADVNYINGSGPFGGSITLTYPDGSLESFQQQGRASYDSSTTVTSLVSQVSVIGGTGPYNDLRGTGSYTASRSTALGGPVHIIFQAYTHQ